MTDQKFIISITDEHLKHIRLTPNSIKAISELQTGMIYNPSKPPEYFNNEGIDLYAYQMRELSDLLVELFRYHDVGRADELMNHLSNIKEIRTFIESFKPIP